MKYKLVIFDLDGTILDTVHQLAVSFNEALKKSGFEPQDPELIKSRIGNGAMKLVLRSIEGLENADPDVIRSDYRDYYNAHCTENTEEFDGITDLLRTLKANGIRTAVVTNKSDAPARKLCDTKFPGLIDLVKGHRDGLPHKPDPVLVNEVLDELGICVEDSIIAGDSEVDIATAKNAGMECISVTWGYKDRRYLIDNGAIFLAEDPAEIARIVMG